MRVCPPGDLTHGRAPSYAGCADEAAAEMHSIYTHAQSELENTVGHIGDEFKEWGTDADECREELRGWHDRLAKLEVRAHPRAVDV